MKDSENRAHQAFSRRHSCGFAHVSDFAPTSLATQLFTTLAGTVRSKKKTKDSGGSEPDAAGQ